MALMDQMRSLSDTIFFGVKREHVTALFVGVGLLVAGAAVYFGHGLYSSSKEQKAYRAFVDCMQEYEQAQSGQVPWTKVEQLCNLAYQDHSGSKLAAYIRSMQADALWHQNKKEEAVSMFDEMLASVSSSSPVYSLYATKCALVKMDMADVTVQQAGLEALRKLATDTNNKNRDVALYYVGLYHWSKDDIETAKKEWTALVEMAKQEHVNSPWAMSAQEKLHYLA